MERWRPCFECAMFLQAGTDINDYRGRTVDCVTKNSNIFRPNTLIAITPVKKCPLSAPDCSCDPKLVKSYFSTWCKVLSKTGIGARLPLDTWFADPQNSSIRFLSQMRKVILLNKKPFQLQKAILTFLQLEKSARRAQLKAVSKCLQEAVPDLSARIKYISAILRWIL